MDKQEVLTKLCMIANKVMDHFEYQYSADCFCGSNTLCGHSFRFDEEILKFIEAAVDKQIAEAKAAPKLNNFMGIGGDQSVNSGIGGGEHLD